MRDAVVLKEHCCDEPLTVTLWSDLMATPLLCQVIPQIHQRGIKETSLEFPRAFQLLNAILASQI